jgi:hypothetical protein
MGNVMITTLINGGYCPPDGDGSTPEEAAQNLWKEITGLYAPDFFLVRYNCKSDVPIPGDEPQVWVRWNSAKDDWENVAPTVAALAKHSIDANRIRTYQEQKAIDRY